MHIAEVLYLLNCHRHFAIPSSVSFFFDILRIYLCLDIPFDFPSREDLIISEVKDGGRGAGAENGYKGKTTCPLIIYFNCLEGIVECRSLIPAKKEVVTVSAITITKIISIYSITCYMER